MSEQLERLARERFGLEPLAPIQALLAGNINHSATVETADGSFVLQELNTSIFPDPDALMANALAIVDAMIEANLPAIRFVPTLGDEWLATSNGVTWRCYRFIPGESTPPITTREEAQAIARVFGRYAKAIESLELTEHFPGYHSFDGRIEAFDTAIASDDLGRLESCRPTVDALLRTIDQLRLSPSYDARRHVPVRNAHNDAKGPNCIVSENGARTVIDLDTTMPGTLFSDIGELVRSATRDLPATTPELVMTQIEAVNRGFLAGWGGELDDAERACILLAGPLLTTENSARFLTDHLTGDKYYGAAEPDQNLQRARVQLELASRQIDAIEWAT
ncbi:MAG: phosphotransferase enzyme family protein [Acidimicrobiales bacterium]